MDEAVIAILNRMTVQAIQMQENVIQHICYLASQVPLPWVDESEYSPD